MRDFQRSGRSAVFADNGMIACSHPTAAVIGLDVLRSGGNAVDAALAAVAALGVVEPQMTGIGGDCFVLYKPANGKLIALNGSGQAPAKATPDALFSLGVTSITPTSPHAVTVPGAVDAWCRIAADHGTRPLGDLLQPAIALAENGYRLTPQVAFHFDIFQEKLRGDEHARALFQPGDKVLGLGDRHHNPRLAETLRTIAQKGRAGFYEGAVAADIVGALNKLGGLHSVEDFAACACDYVEPITTRYQGYDVYECPPNGQGIIALLIMNILADVNFADRDLSEADKAHLHAEATKLAYRDRDDMIGDPRFADVPVARLLSAEHAARQRAKIRMDRVLDPVTLDPVEHKDTTYLSVVDRDGNAVSFINSIFQAFGSSRVAPQSGVLLHNRGLHFRVALGHPDSIGPGKRPMHTIIPGMLMRDGKAVMPFGVMGGHYQAAGHAQFLGRLLSEGLDIQQALEAPRSFASGGELEVETSYDPSVLVELQRRGHKAKWAPRALGGGQAIWIDAERGVLIGGSDPRKDGCALGY